MHHFEAHELADSWELRAGLLDADPADASISACLRECAAALRAAIVPNVRPKGTLYSMDLDPDGIRDRVAVTISGAIALGAQNEIAPPEEHWLTEQQELEAFKAWAGREYRNAETYTARDLAHGFNAWRAARATQAPAPAPEVPDGYKLVLVPDESPEGEPDWEEVRRQAEVATGIKVERNTFSIVIREVRRWLAHRATTPTVIYSPIQVNSHAVEMGREHPNNCETPDEDRFKYLELRGDDKGQGLSVYWKWGHAAGWNDHKKHVAATQAPAVGAIPTEVGIAWQETGAGVARNAVTVDGRTWYRDDHPQVAGQQADAQDAKRLDWIAEKWFYTDGSGCISFGFNECWDAGQHPNLRAAIDAAMESKPPVQMSEKP